MIVVFTGGDELDQHNEILVQYLDRCPEPLKGTLEKCGNRQVSFDNRTQDPLKKDDQLRKLLEQVNLVVKMKGGKPYTKDLFMELKGESKMRETRHLEPELAKEYVAPSEAEQKAEAKWRSIPGKMCFIL